MDCSEVGGGPVQAQGTSLRLNQLGQVFGDANTSTTHRFPKRSLLSRSYDKSRNVPSANAVKNAEGRRPSDWSVASSNEERKQQGVARGHEVNGLAAKLAAKYNAPTRKQSDVFYPRIKSEMCYTEEVYHVLCGHWADRPRIYHRCVGAPDQPLDQLHTVPSLPRLEAQVGKYREHGDPRLPKPGMRMSTPCTNAVTRGPARDEHNKCGRCRIDVEKIVSNQTGMWFSFRRDPVTGKAVFKDRQPESAASRLARSKTSGGKLAPPDQGTMKPIPAQSAGQGGKGRLGECSLTRNGSWSSHGHVEL
ncbi:hypothetical protein LTR24_007400 [Lithohypha guttulata]|uniref:Uncharacterized protein n=1 Tax=Lithohypha guttulata TaxID=1690604 RepID=A0ABR0K312_9EURO|nr:hypothetical protein LTR24_007400 [Lithohypha guttulata]